MQRSISLRCLFLEAILKSSHSELVLGSVQFNCAPFFLMLKVWSHKLVAELLLEDLWCSCSVGLTMQYFIVFEYSLSNDWQ